MLFLCPLVSPLSHSYWDKASWPKSSTQTLSGKQMTPSGSGIKESSTEHAPLIDDTVSRANHAWHHDFSHRHQDYDKAEIFQSRQLRALRRKHDGLVSSFSCLAHEKIKRESLMSVSRHTAHNSGERCDSFTCYRLMGWGFGWFICCMECSQPFQGM